MSTRGDAGVAVATFAAVWAVLQPRGPYRLATELGTQVLELDALTATERARAAYALPSALRYTGQIDTALAHLLLALRLNQEVGDRRAQGRALFLLGVLHSIQGRANETLQCFRDALSVSREAHDQINEIRCLDSLAGEYSAPGQWEDALHLFHQALALSRENGNRTLEAHVLCNLGIRHLGWA